MTPWLDGCVFCGDSPKTTVWQFTQVAQAAPIYASSLPPRPRAKFIFPAPWIVRSTFCGLNGNEQDIHNAGGTCETILRWHLLVISERFMGFRIL